MSQRLYKVCRKYNADLLKLSSAFALHRVDHRLRRLWSYHVNEHLTQRQRKSIFLLAHSVVFAPTGVAILCLWAWTIFVFIFCTDGSCTYVSSRKDEIFTRILISIISVLLTARLMVSSNCQFMYHCLQEYRDSTHAFSLLWKKQHLIPSVSNFFKNRITAYKVVAGIHSFRGSCLC